MMSKQNVYDNSAFFEGYLALRENADNANNLVEKPAMRELIGSVAGKSVLDLGCGYGENCRMFAEMGAAAVVGIDISEKMLAVAEAENSAPNIEYRRMPMENLSSLPQKFDLAVSSLAFHYVEDYGKLIRDIADRLHDGGILVFSQEQPLTTAPLAGAKWIRNEGGEVDHYRLTDYNNAGERMVTWFIDGVIKYHRTFSELINGLVAGGFSIMEMKEPAPDAETMARLPRYRQDIHKPDFLMIKAIKNPR